MSKRFGDEEAQLRRDIARGAGLPQVLRLASLLKAKKPMAKPATKRRKPVVVTLDVQSEWGADPAKTNVASWLSKATDAEILNILREEHSFPENMADLVERRSPVADMVTDVRNRRSSPFYWTFYEAGQDGIEVKVNLDFRELRKWIRENRPHLADD